MNKTKLTAKQLECLREMAKPGARAFFIGGLEAYWLLSTRRGKYSQQVWKLRDLGLIDQTVKCPYGSRGECRINAAGRKALRDAQ